MFQSGTQTLMQAWSEIRREEFAPTRASFDPVRLGPAVTRLFMLQQGPDLKFRLAGASLEAAFQQPLRATSYLRLWSSESRAAVRQTVQSLVADLECAVLYADAQTSEGRRASLEIFLAPLTGPDRRTVDRLVGLQTQIGRLVAVRGERLTLLEHRMTVYPGRQDCWTQATPARSHLRLAVVNGQRVG